MIPKYCPIMQLPAIIIHKIFISWKILIFLTPPPPPPTKTTEIHNLNPSLRMYEYIRVPIPLCANRWTCLTVVSLEQVNKRVHTSRKLWWSDDNRLSTLEIQHIELFFTHSDVPLIDVCVPTRTTVIWRLDHGKSLIEQTVKPGIQPASLDYRLHLSSS